MRWKIILPNLLVVLLVGVGGWLYLKAYYTNYFDDRAQLALERDRGLFEAANQLRAVKFLRTVVARAQNVEVEDVFAPATAEELTRIRAEYGSGAAAAQGEAVDPSTASDEELHMILRLRAHRECQAFRVYFRQEQGGGRTPEIVAILDRSGSVISRDVDPNAPPVGQNLVETYPAIRPATQGSAVRDLWFWNEYLLDVAVAPVVREGQVVGALLVGYDVSNGVAQADRELFGAEVAYIFERGNQWRVHSSSIAQGARRNALIEGVSAETQQAIIRQSMENREQARSMTIDVTGESHIALAGPLSGESSSVRAGYVMLSSVRDVRAPADRSIVALFFGLGGALLVLVVGFFLGWYFLKPVEEIEEGILRIINGDLEHRFEVKSAEFGGLAYRVNQLVAELTGEEEEAEPEAAQPATSAEPPPE